MPVSDFTKENRTYAKNTKDALNDGFLNGIGTDKRFGNTPISFTELENVFVKYGELFVRGFSEELQQANANASGKLDSSFRFEFNKGSGIYEVNIFMSTYAKFVDEGVQGLNGSRNINHTSPYKFKFAYPSKKHIEALEGWIKEKNVTAIITVPKGIASKATGVKSLAVAMGFSIKQRGLKATFFKKKTVEKLIEKFKAEAATAAGADMKINILF
jgi:hypothetical protein